MNTIYLLLAIAAVILLLIWYRTRDRRYLWGLIGVISTLVIVLFVSWLVGRWRGETAGQQVERKLKEMSAAVQAKNADGIFQHVSEQFEKGGTTKAMLRSLAERTLAGGELTEIRIWDLRPAVIVPAKDGKPALATIGFLMKPIGLDGGGELFFRCEAQFIQDGDGQWRLRTFKLFLPNQQGEYPIPQLPN